MTTAERLRDLIDRRFGGRLLRGKHDEDGQACILECASVLREIEWTDAPDKIRCFDLRPINDILVSEAIRTPAMIKLYAAYEGSLDWPIERQKEVVTRIVIRTVNVIIAELSHLSETIRQQCRDAKTIQEAKEAWEEAWVEVAEVAWAEVAWAAEAAKEAWEAAAEAAAWAKAAAEAAAKEAWEAKAWEAWAWEKVFQQTVDIWMEAVGQTVTQ